MKLWMEEIFLREKIRRKITMNEKHVFYRSRTFLGEYILLLKERRKSFLTVHFSSCFSYSGFVVSLNTQYWWEIFFLIASNLQDWYLWFCIPPLWRKYRVDCMTLVLMLWCRAQIHDFWGRKNQSQHPRVGEVVWQWLPTWEKFSLWYVDFLLLKRSCFLH